MINKLTIQQKIQWELEQLKNEMGLDFVAIALSDGQYRDIYWRFALGAQSDRYKKIAVRMGRGMAGKVLQGMSPHVVLAFPEEVQEEVLEYPIFLVESLYSGVGVSINSTIHVQNQAYGVLLVGQRSRREFPEEDIMRVQACAGTLAGFYDEAPTAPSGSEDSSVSPTWINESSRDTDSKLNNSHGSIIKLLQEARAAGITCELLDQRITRLNDERQEEITAILALLVRECGTQAVDAQLIIGQDELGQTLIEFEGYLLHPASNELFLPVMEQLKSLKCDLEIVIEKDKKSVRFTIPTRVLLDEMHWNK
ncbi:hypothetical protein J2T12_004883 [Paenibacillus anaericanus]|uniref:hypothetical protein n=1 Tax=Paenibacillus TaxID=44249 RepID=UPI0027835AFF|nr:hypothetical protein [Paenibacillus anaericanus]MDQ0091446.1 hypothetical protein [Paenibacillus anaericanus]